MQLSEIIDELESLKLKHHRCADEYYSCPMTGECCNDQAEGCDCGADEHNAKISKLIDALKSMLPSNYNYRKATTEMERCNHCIIPESGFAYCEVQHKDIQDDHVCDAFVFTAHNCSLLNEVNILKNGAQIWCSKTDTECSCHTGKGWFNSSKCQFILPTTKTQ